MPPILRPCTLALLLGLPMPALAADIAWRYWSQLPVAAEGLPVFADLDGDGVNEIVYGTRSPESVNAPAQALSVLGQGTGGGLERVVSIPLPLPLYSLVAVRRAGHADSVLVTVGQTANTRLMEFTGRDLQRVRDLLVTDRTRLQLVADINADGKLDLLGDTSTNSGFGFPVVLDYATGALLWQGPEQTDGVTGAQLDADPQLEIISRG
jgi:hypothetical protein